MVLILLDNSLLSFSYVFVFICKPPTLMHALQISLHLHPPVSVSRGQFQFGQARLDIFDFDRFGSLVLAEGVAARLPERSPELGFVVAIQGRLKK